MVRVERMMGHINTWRPVRWLPVTKNFTVGVEKTHDVSKTMKMCVARLANLGEGYTPSVRH